MRKLGLTRSAVGVTPRFAAIALFAIATAIGTKGSAQPFPIPPELAKQLPPGLLPPGFGSGSSAPGSTGTPATNSGKWSGALPGAPVETPPPGIAEWTVLVYADADNDLEGPILDDLDEMERIGSVKGVNVVIQIDRWRPHPASPMANRDDKTNGDWDQAKRFFVTRDDGSTKINSLELQDLGEIDMSHPKELHDFLVWGIKKFPAKKYALVMEDHGSGWKGAFVDEKAPPEKSPMMMMLAELQTGLSTGLKDAGIAKLDLFATDACLMSTLEVADAISPYVKYWVASEELQPGPGFEYTLALGAVAQNPKLDGVGLGKAFVNAMRLGYGPTSKFHDPTVTSALFDMGKIPAVRTAVDKLAKVMAADLEANKIPMGMASEVVDTFGPRTDPISGPKDGFADLVQVAAVVRDTSTKSDSKSAATAVITALDASRLDKHMGEDRPHARGMSIWLPPPEVVAKGLAHYRKTPFGKTSPWADLLNIYSNAFSLSTAPKVSAITVGKNAGNPFGGERAVTAEIEGEVRNAVMVISQDFFGIKAPVEILGVTDPSLYKKLPEGPGVTAWKKSKNTISAKWTPMYATLQGKGGMEFPLVVNRVRLDSTSFDANVGLREIGGTEETVMLRFSMPKGSFTGSKLLSGYFIDKVQGQDFYTPFSPAKLPAGKVAFEPRYTVVDASGKSSQLKVPLVSVKWDKVEDLKVVQRPMIPGKYDITILAEDFNGHVGVGKASTTIP